MKVDVEAIRARADAATPGPWEHVMGREVRCRPGGDTIPARSTADAAFISHARADIPALCDALEHERKVAAAWKALAAARAEVAFSKASSRDGRTPSAEAVRDASAAREALIALGIDPEAP